MTVHTPFEIPSHWVAGLRALAPLENGGMLLELSTLPAALAAGAPARLAVRLEREPGRGAMRVVAVRIGAEFVPFERLDTPWAAFWIASLPKALEAEVRGRRATRPMSVFVPPSPPKTGRDPDDLG